MKTYPIYTVTIQIQTPDGARIKYKLEDCPREALLKIDTIAPVLQQLERSIAA